MNELMTFILKYWLEFLFASFVGIMVAWCKKLQKKLKQKSKEEDFVIQGLKVLLRKELERECNKYLAMGYIPVDESEEALNTVNEIFEPYDGIGGNGTGANKYNKFTALPIREPDTKERREQ